MVHVAASEQARLATEPQRSTTGDHTMDPETRKVLESAVKALADFKRVFGRDLTPALLGEMYVALRLDLSPGRRLDRARV